MAVKTILIIGFGTIIGLLSWQQYEKYQEQQQQQEAARIAQREYMLALCLTLDARIQRLKNDSLDRKCKDWHDDLIKPD